MNHHGAESGKQSRQHIRRTSQALLLKVTTLVYQHTLCGAKVIPNCTHL